MTRCPGQANFTITASQPGGGSYQAATPVSQVLIVNAPLKVQTQVSYTNFTAASRVAGTAVITAIVTGGSNPSGRVCSWAGTGYQSSAQYSITAPTANTSVVLIVVVQREMECGRSPLVSTARASAGRLAANATVSGTRKQRRGTGPTGQEKKNPQSGTRVVHSTR